MTLAILVPAHNEERSIAKTLESIHAAIARAKEASGFARFEARLLVGADGCEDSTARVARELAATVVEFPHGQGKWKTLNALLALAGECDWVVFADAGAIWEEDLLVKCLARTRDPRVIGVAPTYRNPSAGALEALAWTLEGALKRMEDKAGGPVSVHGATVLYRHAELVAALEALGSRAWLNDDVVIPLVLRMQNPGARIRYASEASVRDLDPGPEAKAPREFGRRRRMVRGNMEWIRQILLPGWRKNPTVAYLALRRVFRVFWAYWGLAIVLSAVFSLSTPSMAALEIDPSILIAAFVLGAGFVYKLRRQLVALTDAAAASLLAPLFFSSPTQDQGGWK